MRMRFRLAVLALMLSPLVACSATLPSRLYTLAPAVSAPVEPGRGGALGLGPVELPAYLDRPEIVTREGPHQVVLGEFDKWAEPLLPMFVRLLADRLRLASGSSDVVPLPSRLESNPRYGVAVIVDRFDADENGQIVLDATWRYYQLSDERTLKSGHEMVSLAAEPASQPDPDYAYELPGRDYGALVAGMARAVDELATRISAGLPRAAPARRAS